MQRSRLIYGAKCAVVLTAVSVVIYAHATGPDPRKTGAPGDTTCNQATCHVGTAVNGGPGKVEITYSGGTTYTPGERGTFTVTITDTGTPPRQVYGFQASARLSSDQEHGQAGTLIAGTGLDVQCEDARSLPCRSTAPVQFINHNTPSRTGVWTFQWDAPANGAGDVVVYVAGNAANGNGNETGDRIYTSSIRLTTATSAGKKPSVTSGGVANTWSASSTIATNTWVSIFGSDFTDKTQTWDGSPEFSQGKLPLSLSNVSVTINGKSAPVYFISPGQINVLAPDDSGTGNVELRVKNAAGESDPVTVVRSALSPALLTTSSEGKLRVIGRLNSNANIVLGLPEASSVRPFAPGDVVQFYATGLGPTNPSVPVENVVTGAPALINASSIRILINGNPVQIVGSALVGSGLYQINGVIPTIADGEYKAVIEVAGTQSPDNIFMLIKH